MSALCGKGLLVIRRAGNIEPRIAHLWFTAEVGLEKRLPRTIDRWRTEGNADRIIPSAVAA